MGRRFIKDRQMALADLIKALDTLNESGKMRCIEREPNSRPHNPGKF